jgi:hypothetical protein
MLLKHTQFDRDSTNSLKYTDILENKVSTLMNKGIHIKDIRIGAVENRKRGENDNIFTVPITVNVFSEWFQDYSVDLLKDINVFLTNYCWLTSNIAELPSIEIKVLLEGPYRVASGSMVTTLNPYIPLAQPYNVAPWNYTGTEFVASMPSNVTDWILVELRSGITGATKVATRAAFLLSSGAVVDIDGVSPIKFNIRSGDYYIVIRHRNHLAVMSANPVSITTDSTLYDFTTDSSKYYEGVYSIYFPDPAWVDLGDGKLCMVGGDCDASGGITGTDDMIMFNAQAQHLSGYIRADVNFDTIPSIVDQYIAFNNIWKITKVPD